MLFVHIHLGITLLLCVSEVYCSLHVNTLLVIRIMRKLLVVRKNHSSNVMFILCRGNTVLLSAPVLVSVLN